MRRILIPVALLFAACHGGDTAKLSDIDKATLEKTDAKLQLLQVQFQAQVQPVVKEQNDIIARVCKAAGIDVADCNVDLQTGSITKKAKPAPSAPAAKK